MRVQAGNGAACQVAHVVHARLEGCQAALHEALLHKVSILHACVSMCVYVGLCVEIKVDVPHIGCPKLS